MSVNKRIKKVLEDNRYSNSAFEKQNNLANGTVRKISVEKNFNPSYKVLNAFAQTFPTINLRWLITGEGEMYQGPHLDGVTAVCHNNNEIKNLDFGINRIQKDLEVTSKGMRANKNKVRELERELEKAMERVKQLESITAKQQ